MQRIVLLMITFVLFCFMQELITECALIDPPIYVDKAKREKDCKNPSLQRELDYFQNNKKFGTEYKDVIRIKLNSRKNKYRMGEMVSLDLAIFNVSEKSLFVHKLIYPYVNFKIQDETGKSIRLSRYTLSNIASLPEFYNLINPKEIRASSFNALVGCKDKLLESYQDNLDKLKTDRDSGKLPYQEGLFERDLFVNWGDFCLNIVQPGSYIITAEIENNDVIISPCEPEIKTVVGTIYSNPLSITIIE